MPIIARLLEELSSEELAIFFNDVIAKNKVNKEEYLLQLEKELQWKHSSK